MKNKAYVQVIRPWNELFRFMALRTRHIWFILHSSEVRFITRPVIPMDMDGLRWIPMDPIAFHSTNRYRWIPSKNISALSNFHLTSGTLRRQMEGVTNRIFPIPSKNYVPIGVYWKCMAKSRYPPFFLFIFCFFFMFKSKKTKQKIR